MTEREADRATEGEPPPRNFNEHVGTKKPHDLWGSRWYPERGSNPHIRRYKILSLARLPIPPSGHIQESVRKQVTR